MIFVMLASAHGPYSHKKGKAIAGKAGDLGILRIENIIEFQGKIKGAQKGIPVCNTVGRCHIDGVVLCDGI